MGRVHFYSKILVTKLHRDYYTSDSNFKSPPQAPLGFGYFVDDMFTKARRRRRSVLVILLVIC